MAPAHLLGVPELWAVPAGKTCLPKIPISNRNIRSAGVTNRPAPSPSIQCSATASGRLRLQHSARNSTTASNNANSRCRAVHRRCQPAPAQSSPSIHDPNGDAASAAERDALSQDIPALDGKPSPSGNSAESEDMDVEEAERRLRWAADYLQVLHRMVPSDSRSHNEALVLWKAIRDVPPHMRPRLLDMISAADITRLWDTSSQRYVADASAARAAIGPDYSQWQDFPDDLGQVAVFEGKAVAPVPGLSSALRLDRFRKMFFLHPQSEDLVGRVDIYKGPLGNILYPLYFRVAIGSSIVPATREVADMQLEYVEPAALSLEETDLPAGWPKPRRHLFPFHGGLSDYMRAVGPGVYVGSGWREERRGKDVGRPFLKCMLIRVPDEAAASASPAADG